MDNSFLDVRPPFEIASLSELRVAFKFNESNVWNETGNPGKPRFKRSADDSNFELIYEMEVDDGIDMKTFSYNDTSVQPFNLYR